LDTPGSHYVLLLEGLGGLPLHDRDLSRKGYLRQEVAYREA